MMDCILHKQKPKPDKKGIEGSLAVHSLEGKETTALFFQNERVMAELKKPDIIFINPHGISLKGYEPAGCDRKGRQKFVYQEWFCAFPKQALKGELNV